jgi:hypothetical protein
MLTSTRLAVVELEAREVPAAPFDTLPVLPGDPAALDTARAVAVRGRELGRRTDVFMKVGDSNTDYGPWGSNGYLKPLGAANYNPFASGLAALGQNLLDTWATFRAPVGGFFNSFSRPSTTAYPGYSLPNVLPALPGEIAATNAGVALVMLGTNDVSLYGDAGRFQNLLANLVGTLEAAGVVPILSTIPDNHYGGGILEGTTRVFNQVIANLAGEWHLPLWNLFRQEESLPNSGLESGGVHLTHADGLDGNLSPGGLLLGQNVHNLGALQVLDWYREQVVGGRAEAVPLFPKWTPLTPGQDVYAVGRGAGQEAVVSVYDRGTGKELNRFLAYEATFVGGVQVSVADVNGDGVPDVVTAPGSGGGPVVKVFSGTDGSLIGSVLAFEPSFRTGVNVAAADLDGDGKAEVVVGAGNGGGPAVAVFHGGDLQEVERFFTYEPSFRGGVSVAAADLAGYGPSIVVGSGVGGGPVVKVFRYGDLNPAATFLAFDPSVRDGVQVAAGDLTGDGLSEIAMAPAAGSTHVRVIDPATMAGLASFFAGQSDAPGGVRLALHDGQLLVGSGPGGAVSVQDYSGLSATPAFLPPNDPTRAYGVNVG